MPDGRKKEMLYLLLAIVFAAMISIIMRLSEGRIQNRTGLLAANYLTCMVLALCFLGPQNIFPAVDGIRRTFGLGMLNGVFYMTALMANQYNITRNGVVLPSVFAKMGGLLVPLVVSIFLFGEIPGVLQVVGFVLAIAGILMMNLRSGGGSAASMPALIMLLFLEGFASSMAKVYRELGSSALSDNFLFFTFTSAFILCVIVLLVKREHPGLRELLFGAAIGTSNFFAARFVLKALEAMPAVIVYPSRSVGNIVLLTLAGVLVFKEKLGRQQIIAMAVILAALILLNI